VDQPHSVVEKTSFGRNAVTLREREGSQAGRFMPGRFAPFTGQGTLRGTREMVNPESSPYKGIYRAFLSERPATKRSGADEKI
jgi:hypothetical protein